jgi:cytochrome c
MSTHSMNAALGLWLLVTGSALAAGDPARGNLLYETQCGTCHALDHNLVGPAHRGVYGRKAGSVPDYRYSEAVRSSGVIWTEQTLDQWLSDPEQLIPGQKMGFSIASAQDRADIIAYLKQQSAAPRLAAGSGIAPASRTAPE